MHFARVTGGAADGDPRWVWVEDDVAYAIDGTLYMAPRKGVRLGPAGSLKLLAPLAPASKVVAMLGTWGDRQGRDGPGFLIKPPSTLVNPGDTVIYPDIAKRVNLEPELGVVIGAHCKNVSAAQAKERVLGYTVCNDITAFETVFQTNFPVLYGKTFDTFCVAGPVVVPGLDVRNLVIRAAINGEQFLEINTSKMVWDAWEIVAWISRVMTLEPGDIISCGAPPGFDARAVNPGDSMRVGIDGIGFIENPVRRP